MSATNDYDRARLLLEDALAHISGARRSLQVAGTRMVQRMRTEQEKADVDELTAARVELETAHRLLAGFHPQRLEER